VSPRVEAILHEITELAAGVRLALADLVDVSCRDFLRVAGVSATAVTTCPYCENANHTRLAALIGAEGGPGRRVDRCEACRGYVKTLAVLRATPPEDIPLADLVSVELDVAALEHGYRRPTAPARLLPTRLVAR
jgi:hypothetical protein